MQLENGQQTRHSSPDIAMGTATTMTDQQIAWPQYRITGSGTIAVRKVCCGEVELVSTTAAAIIVKAEQCCRYCAHNHHVHYRKEPKAPVILNTVGYRE